ncbi:IPT/TIG domain-containing protein [Methanospirillum stamsii]|nr:IPT/TIG domain-containing protein [Methanospirillum stamsii]
MNPFDIHFNGCCQPVTPFRHLLFVLTIMVCTSFCPVLATEIVPDIMSLNPDTGYAGFSYLVTVNGQNFKPDMTASLELDGSVLNLSEISLVNNSSLTFRALIPASVKPGYYQFSLVSPDGKVQKLNQAFHVQPPAAPMIQNLSPAQAKAGSLVPAQITGKYFRSGGNVSLSKGKEKIILTNQSVSFTNISGTFAIPVDVAPGTWNVTVTNSDGQNATLPEAFTIMALPAPRILAITPDQGEMDTPVTVAITGSEFLPGAVFSLNRKDLVITGKDVVTDSSGRITGFVLVPSKYPEGLWDLWVTNPDGQSVQKNNAFLSGTPAAPFSLHISPSWAVQGTNREVTIRGMAFLEGDRVTLQSAEKTIQATNITVVSDTQITCTLEIPSDAKTGSWDVVVTSRYNKSDILPSGFRIYDKESLLLAGIEPDVAEQGQFFTATVYGHNLVNGSGISLTAEGEEPILGEVMFIPSLGEMGVSFHIPADAMPDIWDLTLISPSGKELTKDKALKVSYNNTPVIFTIDPDRAPAGTDDMKVTVTGKNFGDNEYLDLNLSLNGTTLPVSGTVSYKGTRAIGYLTIPNGTPTGWYDLSLIRDAGQGKGSMEREMFRVL